MDHVVVTITGGGIFSLYHQAIATILQRYEYYLDQIGSFEIIIDSGHFLKNKKIFNEFFEYEKNLITSRKKVQLNSSNDGFIHFIKVNCPYFDILKSIVKINKINNNIINFVNEFISKNKRLPSSNKSDECQWYDFYQSQKKLYNNSMLNELYKMKFKKIVELIKI